MKTVIRWQGNKSKHLNKLIPYVPEYTGKYIEPFLGSGAMFLKLQPKKWIINDINKDVINVWRNVQSNPNEIIEYFKKFSTRFLLKTKEEKLLYCKNVDLNSFPFDLNRACTFLILLHCCYTPLNFKSLSIQTKDNNLYFAKESCHNNIRQVSLFLNESHGEILNEDYKVILERAKEGDFVFLDPPYFESKNYQFKYNRDEVLDESFIDDLYIQVKILDDKKVKFLITYADTNEIRNKFKEFTIKEILCYRSQQKKYVKELLILN